MEEELLKIWSQFKTTVIFVTHDIEEAIFLADRVVVMKTLPGGIKREVLIDMPRPREPSIIKSKLFNHSHRDIFVLIRHATRNLIRNSGCSKTAVNPAPHFISTQRATLHLP